MSSSKIAILVSGGNSQTANALKKNKPGHFPYEFHFFDHLEWNIVDEQKSLELIRLYKPRFVINTAAYTAVDKAETDIENCFNINAHALKSLAQICAREEVTLIHFSSDYVFHKKEGPPIKETEALFPQGVYARSKALGEAYINQFLPNHIIIRTSWLYSSHGNNFVKTMLQLSSSRHTLNVVSDQIGSPTNATDLALFVIHILNTLIQTDNKIFYGTYHFSNKGETSWYYFAQEIFRQANIQINLNEITTEDFNAAAPRPFYSVMDCSKAEQHFGFKIRSWQAALSECIEELTKVKENV